MSYREIVEKNINEESLKELWREISTAYEEGGEEGVKALLAEKANEITTEFKKLLEQLKKKL